MRDLHSVKSKKIRGRFIHMHNNAQRLANANGSLSLAELNSTLGEFLATLCL